MMSADVVLLNDEYFSQAYEELRRIARHKPECRCSLTLNPTAVVNEVYIRLAESKNLEPTSPEHLKHIVIRAMRHVLVEAARRKAAGKRGGGNIPSRRVELDENALYHAVSDPGEILDLNSALDTLNRQSEFQARVFEYQYFGGLQVPEIAAISGSSEKKVQRSLRLARAFLAVLLSGGKIG